VLSDKRQPLFALAIAGKSAFVVWSTPGRYLNIPPAAVLATLALVVLSAL